MSVPKRILLGCLIWLGLVTFLHFWTNVGIFDSRPLLPDGKERFRIGFLPVT